MLKRRVIPSMLLLAGLWLVAGCFYLPIPEHVDGGRRNDFRKSFGDANSKRALRVGIATRAQVERTFGPPPYATRDGRSIAYVMHSEKGAWVWPLCFAVQPDRSFAYVIRIDFDAEDRIARWVVDHDELEAPLAEPYLRALPDGAIKRLGAAGGALEPTGLRPATQPDAARKRAG